MDNYTNRRLWLKQTALALAGLGLTQQLVAKAVNKTQSAIPGSPLPSEALLLNNNENVYGPSPLARKAILESYLSSNRYPDDAVVVLQKAVAKHWRISEENILFGAGSSEIIGLACLYAAKGKGHIITTDPSYQVWNDQATAFGLTFKRTHLPRTGNISLDELYGPIDNDTRMIYICNPNNPTGTAIDVRAVEQFALNASKNTLVFIDEAYAEYAQMPTLAPIATNNPNIIVAKTFSKIYGLAGARIGYAIAHPATIQTLGNYQPWPSANISAVTTAAAMASLGDKTFIQDCFEKTNKTKTFCYEHFKQLGLDYIPSKANFILFNIDKVADKFGKELQKRNIQVKYRDCYGGKWCRVTMGTMEEMKSFVGVLKEIVG